jgi:hypothetical protein
MYVLWCHVLVKGLKMNSRFFQGQTILTRTQDEYTDLINGPNTRAV